MSVRDTSLEAFQEVKKTIGKRHEQILMALGIGDCNNLMISKRAYLPINVVTARVNELVKMGKVKEAYRDICPYTKRRTIFWKINPRLIKI